MTPADFRATLKAHGLRQRDLMRLLQALGGGTTPDAVTVNRWATGRVGVPTPVSAFLHLWEMLPENKSRALLKASRELASR